MNMRTRLSLAGLLMASILAASGSRHVCVEAMGRSAHVFSQYFRALEQEPLNPVERVVFSFVLAKMKAQQHCHFARHE